jgi:hypothetical protein
VAHKARLASSGWIFSPTAMPAQPAKCCRPCKIQSNYNRAESFVVSHYQKSFTIDKLGQTLIVQGEIYHEKTQRRIMEKLKNYTHQMGIEKIEWRHRGRDSL